MTEYGLKLPPLSYASPRSVEEVVRTLAGCHGEAKILSGGQSLMPMLAFRLAAPDLLVDLGRVPGLDGIAVGEDGVTLGARVRWRDIERDPRLSRAHPLLCAAVRHVAHYQIRNRGTVGGSLAHADPAAEMPAVALACEARIVAIGPERRRVIPAAEFFVAPLVTALGSDELIVSVELPPWPAARRWGFQEFARRKGDFALAGIALFWDEDAGGRIAAPHIAAFGVGDVPLRLDTAESVLAGGRPDDALFARAVEATAEIEPQGDLHADSDYRRALLGDLLARALREATEGDRP